MVFLRHGQALTRGCRENLQVSVVAPGPDLLDARNPRRDERTIGMAVAPTPLSSSAQHGEAIPVSLIVRWVDMAGWARIAGQRIGRCRRTGTSLPSPLARRHPADVLTLAHRLPGPASA